MTALKEKARNNGITIFVSILLDVFDYNTQTVGNKIGIV